MKWPWRKSEKTTPPVREDRPPCPFYGFAMFGGSLMDSKGNQCALAGGHSPCGMAVRRETPTWVSCPRWEMTPEDMQQVREFTIFPDECHPEGAKSWEGMPFGDFIDAVTE